MRKAFVFTTLAVVVLGSLWAVWRNIVYLHEVFESPQIGFAVPGMYYLLYSGLVAGLSGLFGCIIVLKRAILKSWTAERTAALMTGTVVLTHVIRWVFMFITVLLGIFIPYFDFVSIFMLMIIGIWILPKTVLGCNENIQSRAKENVGSKTIRMLCIKRSIVVTMFILALVALVVGLLLPYLSLGRLLGISTILPLSALLVFIVAGLRLDWTSAVFWSAVTVFLSDAFRECVLFPSSGIQGKVAGFLGQLGPIIPFVVGPVVISAVVIWINCRVSTADPSN